MRKQRKTNIKRIISAAVVSALIASGVGYTFVSSAANTITLASSGRFEYDADGNGTINGAAGDIILDSDDLVALKDAVTGLNSSLTAISTKAYGADGVPNYTGQLKDASGNLISGDPDDLESKYYSYQTSHSYTNTQYTNYGVQKYNEGKTSITPEITEGSFSFPRGSASGQNIPTPARYNTTDWYLGYLEGTEYGSCNFNYAKASKNSVTIKAGIGSNDKTMKWYKGPFSGNGIANTGSSAYSYSLHYVMRLPG